MALTGTIIAGVYSGASAIGSFLRIQAGAHVAVPTHHEIWTAFDQYYTKLAFVWNGRPYFVAGTENSTTNGLWTYDENLDKMIRVGLISRSFRVVPFGEKTLFFGSTYFGWGTNLARIDFETPMGVAVGTYDYCFLRDMIFTTNSSQQYIWVAPFNAVPVLQTSVAATNICEIDGEVYTCFNNANVNSWIAKWNGINTFTQIGTGWVPGDTALVRTNANTNVLFKYGGKLYNANSISSAGTRWVRFYEIDMVTGGATDITDTVLPIGHPWRAASPADAMGARLCVIRNDSGSSEQVFLMRMGQSAAAWEVCEFLGSTTPMNIAPEETGVHRIWPPSAVCWDRDADTAEIVQAADSVPSSYLDMLVRTHELRTNTTVNIDPRFRIDGDETPPYTAMTELTGGGSEGKTALSSKPAGIVALADLSDDFTGVSLNNNLWEVVNVYPELARDWGTWFKTGLIEVIPYVQNTNNFRPWESTTARAAGGNALKAKWFMTGAFRVDINLINLVNLVHHASETYIIDGMIKVAMNHGYGFRVTKTAAGVNGRVRSVYMAPNANSVYSAYAANVIVDGEVIRIERSAIDVWTITFDPGGAKNEIITPVGANISEAVMLWLRVWSTTAGASPVGALPGPGFDDVVVTGAGGVGLFDGGVDHVFHWDHITDLGSNVVSTPELYSDTGP